MTDDDNKDSILKQLVSECGVLTSAEANACVHLAYSLELPFDSVLARTGKISPALAATLNRLAKMVNDKALSMDFARLQVYMLIYGVLKIDEIFLGAGAPRTGRYRLGEFLVAANFLDPRGVALALSIACRSRKRLGEVLVERGALSTYELAYALKLQAEVRDAALDCDTAVDILQNSIPTETNLCSVS